MESKKYGTDEPRQGKNKDVDLENGLEDMGWGGGSWGKVRVSLTYIRYQM